MLLCGGFVLLLSFGASARVSVRCIFIYPEQNLSLGSPGKVLPVRRKDGGGCPWPWRAEGLW